MAEKRISFSVTWEWPEGEVFETISSLTIHEAQAVEDMLAEIFEGEGFGEISTETAAGETPLSVGVQELYAETIIPALKEAGFDEIAERLEEEVNED